MKKKFLTVISLILAFMVSCFLFAGCNSEKSILVVSREASSGTREAFDKFVGITDNLSAQAEELGSTGLVKEKVSSVKTAIGYISLASLDDNVKALKVDGVSPSAATVRDGSYKIQRPFLLLKSTSVELTGASKDFYDYCTSKTCENSITSEGGVTTTDFSERKEYTAPSTALSGEIKLVGSTSMEDMVLELVASYKELLGYKADGITFTFSFNGSSEGRKAAKNDTNGNVIGLASSSKADSAYTEYTLCLDAVAVIVNKDNNEVENVTKEQLLSIFTGEITKFSELK